MYPEKYSKEVSHLDENFCPGGSLIVSPQGTILERTTIPINLEFWWHRIRHGRGIKKSKLDFDVIGHYSRDDIFKFEAS